MIDRLAVVVAGELRTWTKISNYILSAFKNKAKQVDYFFVTWDTSENIPINKDNITMTFQNENLIAYKIVKNISESHTFYRQQNLIKIGNILKQEYELSNNFVYDQVVVTRPDVFLKNNEKVEWIHCTDFVYRVGWFIQSLINENLVNICDDLYYRSNSMTDDFMSVKGIKDMSSFDDKLEFMSVFYTQYKDNHSLFAKFCDDHQLSHFEEYVHNVDSDFQNFVIIRSHHNINDIDLNTIDNEELSNLFPRHTGP